MARFTKKQSKNSPGINTASLPDIIFMLLFFFMVTTVMRETTLFVKINPPTATEAQKLEKKSLVSYIYIGPPMKVQFGTESRIQLNDRFATVDDIQEFIASERESHDEADKKFLTTSLKVDKNTKMGVVTDVKQELRQVGAFKVNYSTLKKSKKQ
ncbi:MAG: biopolymer transporter ExbD [Bacteroidales bacterium]|nr:biopolymer transporter ExbD [Bacteroidales bacterium]